MKKTIIILAIILINMNFLSCTAEDVSEDVLIEEQACCDENEEVLPPPPPEEEEEGGN